MIYSAVKNTPIQSRLLLDELSVANTEHCTQRFFQAVKDPASPILKATEAWEGDGPYTWCSRMLYLPETNRYRMYYTAFENDPYHYRWGMAESEDGLNWVKPALYTTEYEGKKTSYCLQTEGFDLCKPIRTVAYDSRPECPAEERWKGMAFTYNGTFAFYSADGIHWKAYSQNPIWRGTSDIIHVMWDEKLQKFVAYYKLWRLVAKEKDETSPEGVRPLDALCVGFDIVPVDDEWSELVGVQLVHHHPHGSSTTETRNIIVRVGNQSANDGGGGNLIGEWYTKRVVCRAVSDDFLHWTDDRMVMNVDELDRPDSNIQIAQVFTMGEYYLAFLTMHDQRGYFDQQLAFSQDGIHWKRPWRGNLIGRGACGEFDSGMVTAPVDPILMGSQMLIYYGGCTGDHAKHGEFSIGRAMLRRDGFACWYADNETALLETTLWQSNADVLRLNVDAEAGWVTAALLDENGCVIPGFTHEECNRIRDDSATWPDCFIPVTWHSGAMIPRGKIRIQLRFENASVYSIAI